MANPHTNSPFDPSAMANHFNEGHVDRFIAGGSPPADTFDRNAAAAAYCRERYAERCRDGAYGRGGVRNR